MIYCISFVGEPEDGVFKDTICSSLATMWIRCGLMRIQHYFTAIENKKLD